MSNRTRYIYMIYENVKKEGQIKAGTVCANQIVKVLKGMEPDYCVNKKFM